ncbi:MAG TPA: hypothetical protein VKB63_11740 [Gemmatimonadales bacterium]|nr:hypothetical protein [Gemmatimonadales bacterium]
MKVARIRVSRAGEIWCDDVRTSLAELGPRLAQLRAAQGVVWYYREEAGDEPAPEAMAVVRMVVEQRLPISMSTRADFGDVVQADGTAVPRGRFNTLS